MIPSKYTIESVLKGHPDKVCDQICDSILDAYLRKDPLSHVAIESLGTGNELVIAGEVLSSAEVNVGNIANNVYSDIGYDNRINIIDKISKQSEQLRNVVNHGKAGDQGIMYGFACNAGTNYLPDGIFLINEIARNVDRLRTETDELLPDGKVQLTFDKNAITNLTISIQHRPESDLLKLKSLFETKIVNDFLSSWTVRQFHFNYNSNFIKGGFQNDTGLSGRKIIIDTYGGLAPHGGGSFSGKDPTKMDRTGAYMARFVAKNVVANNLANECTVAIAYGFGVEEPIMVSLNTEDKMQDKILLDHIKSVFDFRPQAIIERLDLRNTSFRPTSVYGHFSDPNYEWERIIEI